MDLLKYHCNVGVTDMLEAILERGSESQTYTGPIVIDDTLPL